MHLGTAFQIIDDVLDYSGNESDTGKHLGDDLAEGKPTLPLIYARERGTPEIAAAIRKAIESGGLEEFDAVLKAVHDSGALDAARDAARHEAALARNALQDVPESRYKQALLELAEFAVARTH
jgi:octaprenyl-diphosphate synthase